MPAYMIVNVDVKDPKRYERYRELVSPTIAQYGGRYLARGGRAQAVEGDWTAKRVVIVEWPTYERALEWWSSPEYAPAKELRHEIAETDIMLVEAL